jgi:hypothetical protein
MLKLRCWCEEAGKTVFGWIKGKGLQVDNFLPAISMNPRSTMKKRRRDEDADSDDWSQGDHFGKKARYYGTESSGSERNLPVSAHSVALAVGAKVLMAVGQCFGLFSLTTCQVEIPPDAKVAVVQLNGRRGYMKWEVAGRGSVGWEVKVLQELQKAKVDRIPSILYGGTTDVGAESVDVLVTEDMGNQFAVKNFDTLVMLSKQLFETFNGVHHAGYAHGDVSTANIVYDKLNQKLILIDFEQAYRLNGTATKNTVYVGGTVGFVSDDIQHAIDTDTQIVFRTWHDLYAACRVVERWADQARLTDEERSLVNQVVSLVSCNQGLSAQDVCVALEDVEHRKSPKPTELPSFALNQARVVS